MLVTGPVVTVLLWMCRIFISVKQSQILLSSLGTALFLLRWTLDLKDLKCRIYLTASKLSTTIVVCKNETFISCLLILVYPSHRVCIRTFKKKCFFFFYKQ